MKSIQIYQMTFTKHLFDGLVPSRTNTTTFFPIYKICRNKMMACTFFVLIFSLTTATLIMFNGRVVKDDEQEVRIK